MLPLLFLGQSTPDPFRPLAGPRPCRALMCAVGDRGATPLDSTAHSASRPPGSRRCPTWGDT